MQSLIKVVKGKQDLGLHPLFFVYYNFVIIILKKYRLNSNYIEKKIKISIGKVEL